jgi:hypothetical protein
MAAVQLGEMTPFAKEMLALGRNEQPERLWRAWWGGEIDDETLREWILPTWQLAEFPARYLRHRDWLDMFGATGFLSDGADEAPDPLTVYRGAEPCGMRGFSWSWEPQRAEWFACRLALAGRPASVYEVTLRRDLLLAVIGASKAAASAKCSSTRDDCGADTRRASCTGSSIGMASTKLSWPRRNRSRATASTTPADACWPNRRIRPLGLCTALMRPSPAIATSMGCSRRTGWYGTGKRTVVLVRAPDSR